MSQAALKSAYYSRLASAQTSSKCTCNSYSYNNNFGDTMSKILMVGSLTASGVSVFTTLFGAIGAGRSSKQSAAGQTATTVKPNSVFTYGTDNNTDYASNVVTDLNQKLEDNKKSIEEKTNSLTTYDADANTEGSIANLEAASEKVKGEHKQLSDRIDELEGSIPKLKEQISNAKTKNQDTTALESKLKEEENELAQKKLELPKKTQEKEAAETKLAEAKAGKTKIEEEIKTLQTEQAEIVKQLNEYNEYNTANGIASERDTHDQATKNIKNNTFDLQSAKQWLNEYSDAKRAYEDKVKKGTATDADKAKLKEAAQHFMDEYNDGDASDSTKKTLKGSYDLVKNYIDRLDKKAE